MTQAQARQLAKNLIVEHPIDLIFEPAPITPKGLSFMYNMEVPVVIRPLTGGLTQAMIRLAASPQLREQMGEAAKQRVRQHYFDWDSKCDRIVEIFSETLHKSQTEFIVQSLVSSVKLPV